VNYLDKPYVSAPGAARRQQNTTTAQDSTSLTVDVAAAQYKHYTVSGAETQQQQHEKAFLLSCATGDMTRDNLAVQLVSVVGSAAVNDTLVLTALDSETSQSFSGSNIASTFNATTDVTSFSASSQYYVTWSSDSAAPASSLTITYQCANTTWFVSGAGAPDGNSGAAVASPAAMLMLGAALTLLQFVGGL